MITTTYILLAITGLLVIAAIAMAFRDRLIAACIAGGAILCGVGSYVTASQALNARLPQAAYRAVQRAAATDPEVDAVAQFMLQDNVITAAEYGQIAEVYRDKTGKELNDLSN